MGMIIWIVIAFVIVAVVVAIIIIGTVAVFLVYRSHRKKKAKSIHRPVAYSADVDGVYIPTTVSVWHLK